MNDSRRFQEGQLVKVNPENKTLDHILDKHAIYQVDDPDECCGSYCFEIKGKGSFRFYEEDFLPVELKVVA